MPRIALLQHPAQIETSANIEYIQQAVRDAARQGAQIICTQELFWCRYFCQEQKTDYFQLALEADHHTIKQFQNLCQELGIVLILSGFEKRASGLYHNTAWGIDTDGSLLGLYRKNHIPQDPGFEEKFYFTPGDKGYQCWKTSFGNIAVLICWDQWFPEAARLVALQGAQLILYPTAIGWLESEKEQLGEAQHCAWETVMRGHAVANNCYVAAINRVGREDKVEFWGQSFICNYYGQITHKASPNESETLLADLDFSELQEHRQIWPFLRDRRIDTYGAITQRFCDDPI